MALAQDNDPKLAAYAHPERLVTTEWLAEHLGDPRPRRRRVRRGRAALRHRPHPGRGQGRLAHRAERPGHPRLRRRRGFAEICGERGIGRDTTVVFYGDKNNWWATYALWVFTLFGHPDVRLLDGGRAKWVAEGRELTTEAPKPEAVELPGGRARRRDDPGLPGRRARAPRPAAGRRALARRVHRRAAAHARLPAGRRAARRPHPGRGAACRGRGPPPRTPRSSRAPTSRPSTSPSRASRPTTTSSPTAASASAPATPGSCSPTCSASPRPQLRRQLDRVGQHRAGPDRAGHRAGERCDACPPALAELVDDFADLGPKERLQLLLELSEELPELPQRYADRPTRWSRSRVPVAAVPGRRGRGRGRPAPCTCSSRRPGGADDPGFRLDHVHRARRAARRDVSPCRTTSTSRWASARPSARCGCAGWPRCSPGSSARCGETSSLCEERSPRHSTADRM